MTITERIKQESRMISRPLYVFLGKDECEQILAEKPKEIHYTPDGKVIFDIIEVIEVNKKSFFMIAG